MFFFLLSLVASACLMEGWSALVHRAVWHGPLWWLHRSHHAARGLPAGSGKAATSGQSLGPGAAGFYFELNDALVVLHAGAAMALMIWALRAAPCWQRDVGLGIAAGMTLFGALYALVHDAIAHGRLPALAAWLRRPLAPFVAAHRVHHVHGGPPYGFFLSPWLLRRAAAQLRAQRRVASRSRLREGNARGLEKRRLAR